MRIVDSKCVIIRRTNRGLALFPPGAGAERAVRAEEHRDLRLRVAVEGFSFGDQCVDRRWIDRVTRLRPLHDAGCDRTVLLCMD